MIHRHRTCGNSLHPPAPKKPRICRSAGGYLVVGDRGGYWFAWGETLSEAWQRFDRGPRSRFREELRKLLDEIQPAREPRPHYPAIGEVFHAIHPDHVIR